MIQPTIGRRVWYWPSSLDKNGSMAAGDAKQPCDAGVVYVHSDRCVNLTVADHNGVMHARGSIRLVQPEDEIPEGGGYATWMDYQVGNAR